MTTFKTFVQGIVNDNINKDADLDLRLIASQNRQLERKDASLKSFETAINILAMNSFNPRFITVETENGTRIVPNFQRDFAPARELWNGIHSHGIYREESEKLNAQYGDTQVEKARAVIKRRVNKDGKKASNPVASYIPATPSASTTMYDQYNIYMADGKTKVYSPTINFYTILGYKVYRRAVVLEIIPADEKREYHSFDEVLCKKVTESVDHSRDEEEKNTLSSHLVFVYEPFDRYGKPNRYDGFTQLKDWLKSMKCVSSTNPASLGDALKAIVGQTISIPRAFSYSLFGADTSHIINKKGEHVSYKQNRNSADDYTVYTVFGDFDLFDRCFSNESSTEYQSISEFSDRYELDKDGNKIPETFEVLASESYMIGNDRASFDKKNSNIIKYDCHREFVGHLPAEYSHLLVMFD